MITHGGMKRAAYVFDLDGTLVNSVPGICRGLNLALEKLGYPTHSEQAVAQMVGRGALELCRSALAEHFHGSVPSAALDELHAGFAREYPQTWQSGTVPYEGIELVLQSLVERGIPIGILSNKPHEVTVPLVKEIFPHIPFRCVMGFSDCYPRKPDPSALLAIAAEWGLSPAEICMVGDSAHDGNTAVNAGTDLVLVGWGYSNRPALEAFGVPICETMQQLTSELS